MHSPRLQLHPEAGLLHLGRTASVFLVPVVRVAFVAEAVRPIPGPVGSDQARDNDAGLEPSELPGPARDGDHSLTTRKIEDDLAERDVVARARRVEGDVTVQHGSTWCDCVDDPRADLDVLEVRGRDRAEATGEARVLRALLGHVESSAAQGGLRQRPGPFRRGHLRRGQTRYDLLRSRRVRAGGDADRANDGGGDEKFAADHLSLRSTEIRYRGRVRA